MMAITLWQPWASGIFSGFKEHETRSWSTKRRGLLAVHAGKRCDNDAFARLLGHKYPVVLGSVLCIVDLLDVVEMTPASIASTWESERAWGDWRPGRFAWKTRLLVRLTTPIVATGHQGIWEWSAPPMVQLTAEAARARTEGFPVIDLDVSP